MTHHRAPQGATSATGAQGMPSSPGARHRSHTLNNRMTVGA
jgi:hypothetical protein